MGDDVKLDRSCDDWEIVPKSVWDKCSDDCSLKDSTITTIKIPMREFPHFLKLVSADDPDSQTFRDRIEHLTIYPDSITVEQATKVEAFDVSSPSEFVDRSYQLDGQVWNFEVKGAAETLARTMSATQSAMKDRVHFKGLSQIELPNLKSLHIGPSNSDFATGQFLHDDKWVSPDNYTMSILNSCDWDRDRRLHDSTYNLIKATRQNNADFISQLMRIVPVSCIKSMLIPFGASSLTIPTDVDDLISKHGLEIWVSVEDAQSWVDGDAKTSKHLSCPAGKTLRIKFEQEEGTPRVVHDRQRIVSCQVEDQAIIDNFWSDSY